MQRIYRLAFNDGIPALAGLFTNAYFYCSAFITSQTRI